jgi:hypothetical protein
MVFDVSTRLIFPLEHRLQQQDTNPGRPTQQVFLVFPTFFGVSILSLAHPTVHA